MSYHGRIYFKNLKNVGMRGIQNVDQSVIHFYLCGDIKGKHTRAPNKL